MLIALKMFYFSCCYLCNLLLYKQHIFWTNQDWQFKLFGIVFIKINKNQINDEFSKLLRLSIMMFLLQ